MKIKKIKCALCKKLITKKYNDNDPNKYYYVSIHMRICKPCWRKEIEND